MSLPSLSVKRPVMAVMISMTFVVFGLVGFFRVGVQANPDITFPVITVTTLLPGGNTFVINEAITKPIEAKLNTIAGVKNITSTSKPGSSQVEITFNLGTNIDAVFNEVQSKLNQVRAELPKEAKPPEIQKESIGAAPIMLIALYGDRTIEQLDDIARTDLQKKLEGVAGVAEVNIIGSGKVVVMVTLNMKQMAAFEVSSEVVRSAFTKQHVQLPGGFVHAGDKQFSLSLDLEFHNLSDLENMVIAYRDNAPIYLKNVATVKLAVPDKQNVASLDGKTALGINIVKRPEANTVEVVEAVKQRMQQLQATLPSMVYMKVVYENAQYILAVVHELEEDIILSILAAALIIWIFLRSLRSTLIIIAAIPVSLLGAILAIYAFGFTLNIITLLGIILLVGVVVDDAIVVLENVYRQMEQHQLSATEATLKGSQQVVFAVLAASLSLVSIFLPVVFMGGTLGLFFKSFALVVTAGVLISLLVSLTLTPVLCAKFLRVIHHQGVFYQKLEQMFVTMENFYRKYLNFSLRFPWLMVALVLFVVVISIPIFMVIDKAFMPDDKNSGHFQILVQTAQGSSGQYTKSRMVDAEKILAHMTEIATSFSSLSKANSGTISVNLVEPSQRQLSQSEIMAVVQEKLTVIPGAMFIVQTQQQNSNITFEVRGADFVGTVKAAYKLYDVLSKESVLMPIYLYFSLNQPQYQLVVNRVLASSMGISVDEVGTAAMVLSSDGVRVGKFNRSGGNVRNDIVIRADEGTYVIPEDLSQVYVLNQKGKLVSLDTIASFTSSLVPIEITRSGQEYSIAFTASPKIALNKAVQMVQTAAKENLPHEYTVEMTGDTAALGNTERSMAYTLILIVILMYMVLASQFDSFMQPFIIMVAQPLALIGGLVVLWITQQTLNIYSMIGALLLMGLVAKNSILLIDLTNQYRAEGASVRDALLKACPLRMRPVLMTSCAIILAMLPAAVMSGEASSAHQSLAVVIIGGMISSTILTLLVVPALYLLLERKKQD